MTEMPNNDTGKAATRTVLVVDDNEMVRNLVVRILEYDGLTVLAAATGPEAIQLVREPSHHIGCVLQDLTMPDMSGEEVIFELLQINPELPILAYSGTDEASAAARLSDLKISGFIQKPFKSKILIAKIRELMQVAHD